jgi:DNA topoisomerase-2
MSDTPAKKVKKAASDDNKTVEEIYQKKSQLEHILLRPDTYIGTTEAEEQEMWVFDTEEDMIKKRKIKYVPGLYKIVDEILVNAADNKV